jgi:hypothetical protein
MTATVDITKLILIDAWDKDWEKWIKANVGEYGDGWKWFDPSPGIDYHIVFDNEEDATLMKIVFGL